VGMTFFVWKVGSSNVNINIGDILSFEPVFFLELSLFFLVFLIVFSHIPVFEINVFNPHSEIKISEFS
jgi:hypothetical protein